MAYAWLVGVNYWLFYSFRVISLHAFLSLFKLFVLYGTPAMLGVPFV